MGRLAWLTLEAGSLGLFLLTGNALCLGLCLGLSLPVPLGLVTNLLVRRRLRLQVELSGSMRKGQTRRAQVTVESGSPLPVLKLRCRLKLQNRLTGETASLTVSGGLSPRGTCRMEAELGAKYCGRLRLQAEKLYLYDCFGVLPVPVDTDAHGSVTVLPETFDTVVEPGQDLSLAPDADRYSPLRPGYDLSETFEVREYAPGDSPRQIHWKLSGKLDRLMVREPSLPVSRSLLLFWERSGQDPDPRLADAQAEVIASLGRALVQQSLPFTLGWNEERRCILQPIATLEDLTAVMPRLFNSAGSPVSGPELLMQTLTPGAVARCIFVGASIPRSLTLLEPLCPVSVLSCGDEAPENAIRFTADHYPRELARLVL